MTDERKPVKLSKSEVTLLNKFRAELAVPIRGVQELVNEVMFYKLRDMATEKGIDLENGDWQFQGETNTFVPITPPEPRPEPQKTTVKKRGSTKRKTKASQEGDA